jgi:hypothetical protein
MELICLVYYIFQRNQSIFIVLLAKFIASVANTVTLGLIFLCLKILNSAVKFLDKIAIAAFFFE